MRHLIWVWLSILFVSWGLGLHTSNGSFAEVGYSTWFASAAFFAVIFLISLFNNQKVAIFILLSLAALLTWFTFSTSQGESTNPYVLIIFTYIAAEAGFRLPKFYFISLSIISAGGLFLTSNLSFVFTSFYIVVLSTLFILAFILKGKWEDLSSRHEALLDEYRRLKRTVSSNETHVRQEERTHIGREIHDRVGHKLTSLLMQIEVLRLKQDTEDIRLLKELAKQSLDETRNAVKAMSQEEVGGLSAIIRLIRKLEAENFIRINFSIKNRAFSADLDVEQTVTTYRAVQEALTNVMRHSKEREANIVFESPGERVFRFEISNPVREQFTFREGYGLTSMRERVKQSGGTLDLLVYQNQFIVRGTLPLVERSGER
ncbi:sensor histidine kinase [Halalkalibacillus halophilus]|uniref:sensor histidine kinase n=1 Tax=Halalkalibacillus halophilus TaxID=392827 RepID=UPI000401B0DB|nr:histidine kinase [Halalkalibacillus halophilus]